MSGILTWGKRGLPTVDAGHGVRRLACRGGNVRRRARSIILLVLLAGFGAWSGSALAAVCTSVASANWSNKNIWNCGRVPTAADAVAIASPHTVIMDIKKPKVASLTVNAGATVDDAGNNLFTTGNVVVNGTFGVSPGCCGGGGTITMQGANTTLSGAGSIVDVTVEIDSTGVAIPAGATLKFSLGGQIDVGANTSPAASGLTINGTITGAGQQAGNPLLKAQAGATVTINGTVDAPLARAEVKEGGTVVNNGTVSVSYLKGKKAKKGRPAGVWTQGPNSTLTVTSTPAGKWQGTLNASAAGNTVNYGGTANPLTPSGNAYHHLTLSGNGNQTLPTGLTVAGNFTMSGTAATTAPAALTVGGNFVIGAGNTFNPGAGTVTLNGATAQTISSPNPVTFNNLTITNAANPNITLATNVTVNGTLTGTANLTSTCPVDHTLTSTTPAQTLHSCAPSLTPGSFNAFETTTPAGAITGRIYTRLAGAAFGLDVVAISGGAQMNTFNNAVTVELLGNQTAGVPLDAQNCPTSFTLVQTVTPNPSIAGGRSTVSFAAVANAWKDVRVRVRYPVASPTVTSCSTDNFAIRPSGFTVSSTNAGNTGTSGAPAIKTGAVFNLTAASLAGYNGTPAIDNAAVTGTPTAGTIGGAFAAAPPATGTAAGNAFFYSEAGNFGLNANAVFDNTFTSVDQPGDCTADFSNALVGGKYGCKFGSSAVPFVAGSSGFGRFIPDNFNVTYNTPAFGTACGTFGYVGQGFSFTTAPVMTVVARQGTANGLTNATTANYAGAYMKLTNASLGQAPYGTTAGRYSRFDALGGGATPALDTGGLPPAASDPAIGAFANGVGTLTFGSGTGLLFTRSIATPNAPFDADIALAINVVDADGVTFAGNPAAFGSATAGGGIAFGGGKGMRFGRLKLSNAHGSESLKLPVPMEAQYWNGSAFVRNAADNCTTLAAGNVKLTAPPPGVSAVVGGAFSSGVGSLTLTKPAAPAKVAVDLCVDLGADPGGGTVCIATTSANLPWLQGLWRPGANYNNDPGARATFGVYKGGNEFIYLREVY